MQIGRVSLQNGLCLAPMAGFTDHAMRASCHAMGAEYTVTEMVSAKAVCYGDKKTPLLARVYPEDGACAVQLFGSEETFLAEAARRLADGAAGGIMPLAFDINMGCPVPKVAGNGEGSALMKAPALVERLVATVVKATTLPVTVKIRSGWDSAHINAPEVARAAESGGAAAIFVHARTRTQMYSGKADYSVIAAVKQAVSVPVVGNGDVVDGESALRLLRETGCDGLMVGRAAVGNPFVFSEILAALQGKTYARPDGEAYYHAAMAQLAMRAREKGEAVAVRESRKQMAMFVHGFPAAAACRARIHEASTIAEMEECLSILCN
ncbi:MAG: tRNA dihydrouridine synthase DusB [Clostridia bacterium]|nr:tRNA dihydrouridine synthase DusB [Clostridia bacterium]